MNNPLNKKINDGIKRSIKKKKKSIYNRSYDISSNGETEIHHPINVLKRPLKKNIKKTMGSIKRRRKDSSNLVLGDFDRPEIPEIILEKSFYTEPKRISDNTNIILLIKSFFKSKKKYIGHIIRIGGVMIALFLVLGQHPKAYIVVDPHVEYQKIDKTIELTRNPNINELGFDIIALSDEESISLTPNEQRRVERKSQGEITIFNSFSTEPQRLLPETRFESASGKIYQLGDSEIFVPGRTPDAAGSIQTIVFAENAGDEYNIDSTDFTIPGFKEAGLDAKYNGMYAASTSSFTDGFIGSELFISESQRKNTQEKLQQQLREGLVLRLNKEKTDRVIIINDSVNVEYRELNVVSGDNNQDILSQGGTVFGLVISMDNLFDYLTQNYIQVPDGENAQVIDVHNLQISLTSSLENFSYQDSENIKVTVTGDILIVWDIDKEILAFDMSEKNKKDIVPFFISENFIDKATVQIRPFWRNTLPQKQESIIITENNLDQI